MIKVKAFFSKNSVEELEQEINGFLVCTFIEKFKDIKFTQSEDEDSIHYSALLIWE
jgi:hypothetical protein